MRLFPNYLGFLVIFITIIVTCIIYVLNVEDFPKCFGTDDCATRTASCLEKHAEEIAEVRFWD